MRELLGRLGFSGPVSTNDGASCAGTRFVAAGLGGLKILRIQRWAPLSVPCR